MILILLRNLRKFAILGRSRSAWRLRSLPRRVRRRPVAFVTPLRSAKTTVSASAARLATINLVRVPSKNSMTQTLPRCPRSAALSA